MQSDIESILEFFEYEHLPAGPVRDASKPFGKLATVMAEDWPDHPQTLEGLRKLLEAKDCAVRAVVSDEKRKKRESEGEQACLESQST